MICEEPNKKLGMNNSGEKMDQQNKDKISVGIMIVISLAVIVTVAIFAMVARIFENFMVAVVTMIVVGVAVIVMAIAIRGFLRDIRAGMPLKDERSKRIIEKASSTSFIFMIYLLLALGWYSDYVDYEIVPRHISSAGILGGVVLFFIMWAYYSRNGVSY